VEAFDVAFEKIAAVISAHQRAAIQISTMRPAPNMAESIYPKLALRT
jgi:hypothetical protein